MPRFVFIGPVSTDNAVSNIVGYKIFSLDHSAARDFSVNQVKSQLQTNNNSILGLSLTNGAITTTNGSLNRYPAFNCSTNQIIRRALVILAKIDDAGYRVYGVDGKQHDYVTDDLIAGVEQNNLTIANAKIVTKAGSKFISAISGGYYNIEIKDSALKDKVLDTSSFFNTDGSLSDEYLNDATGNLAKLAGLGKEVEAARKKKIQEGLQNDTISDLNQQNSVEAQERREKQLVQDAEMAKKLQVEHQLGRVRVIPYAQAIPDSASHAKDIDITGFTVEDKLSLVVKSLMKYSPFAYLIYQSVQSLEVPEDGEPQTMGVTVDKLYWNPKYIKEHTLPELYFTMLHEMYHILMQHRARAANKEHNLWNIACDLYINALICHDYGIKKPGEPYKISNKYVKIDARGQELMAGYIALPLNSLMSWKVDVDNDTAEMIYAELNASIPPEVRAALSGMPQQGQGQSQQGQNQQQQQNQGQGQNQQQQGQNQQGQNQQGQGQGQQQQQGQQQGQGQGQQQQGQNQQGQGQGQQQQGQGQQQQGQQGQNPQGQGQQGQGQGQQGQSQQGQQGQGPGQGKGQGQGQGPGQQGQGQNGPQEIEVEFRGGKFKVKVGQGYGGDLINDKDTQGKSGSELGQQARSQLIKIDTMRKMRNFGGEAGSSLERMFELEKLNAEQKLDWRNLLRNKLNEFSKMETSFSRPDRRFVSRKTILPGPVAKDPTKVKNIKICIDTSGSISDEELRVALSQIKDIFKRYDAEGEILYWDTQIRATYEFKDVETLLKARPQGGGGTEANCVFEEFTGPKYKRGNKRKPAPSLVLVFTDGYFGEINPKFTKEFKDKTFWIINDDGAAREFKVPFGKMAPFKIKRDY